MTIISKESNITKALNKKYERKGSLFKRGFNKVPIVNERQWQETFLYIHLNPIKHGFTENIEDCKWSSWQAYKQSEKKSLLERDYYRYFFDGIDHVKMMIESKKELLINKEFE